MKINSLASHVSKGIRELLQVKTFQAKERKKNKKKLQVVTE